MGAVVLVAGVFGAGIAFDRTGTLGDPIVDAQKDPELALIEEAWAQIHDKYVDRANLNDKDLAYGAIEGITEAVGDTGHTSFLTPDELKQTHDGLAGTFVGVGIELDLRDGKAVIAGIIRGGPAEAAGVRQGDTIVAVDGTSVDGHRHRAR